MSLGARATKGGAKGKDRHAQDKGKSDKPQPKEKVKPQATTEQLRMANMIDRKADDTADVRKMVQDLMEMTCRTEEEVCSALHDSDNDVVAACNLLLETDRTVTGEWQTSEKKKKKPPAATNNGEVEAPREPRSRSGPRPRRGEGERGERGDGATRGRGSGRGGRGAGRGGRGGARGGRGGPRPRSDRSHDWPHHPQASDANPMGDTFPATEDWDNEEWSGSLSDTKVFTPSVTQQAIDGDASQLPPTEDWDAPEPAPAEGHIPTYTYHNPAAHHVSLEQQLNSGGRASPVPPADAPHLPPEPFLHHQPHQVQPMGMSGSLTAAQSQYLSQLTQQSLAQQSLTQQSLTQQSLTQQSQRLENSVYTTNYGVYGTTDISSQRKPQRARVPPPSKIPVSAVEMPGGAEGAGFLDVSFGALDELPDPPKVPQQHHPSSNAIVMPVPSPAANSSPPAPQPAPVPAHEPAQHQEPTPVSYTNATTMLSESLSSAEAAAAASQPLAAPEPVVSNSTSSLSANLSASMKQLAVSANDAAPAHLHMSHHRPKPQPPVTATPANLYAHHAVSHHPPAVYSANVYAPQVNSNNAALPAAAGLPPAYPSSVTLTQYQPMINSYQTSSTAGAYNSSALYTAAPYQPYQPPAAKPMPKDNTQYDTSSVASSNSLTNTSTTQQTSAAAKTTTSGHVPSTANSSSGSTAASQGYAGGALYGAASQGYAAYDEQIMRSTMPHHMGGYYEVAGYGVGVGGGARDGTFGLSAGDRFGRTDAASPQQVPTAALPPGYAYYYQPPPPTTYQYGVYPVSQFGAGSNVGGVGGVAGQGKVGTYAQQQQPQYDAQDSYKPGGGYTGNANKAGGAATADLTNTMYAKTHVTLNKVNSYEKAGFHSGTPPPFGAASHLYIAAPPLHHHHAPQQHQMDVRMNSSQNRRESGSSGGRANSNKPAHSKPAYSHSYWPPN